MGVVEEMYIQVRNLSFHRNLVSAESTTVLHTDPTSTKHLYEAQHWPHHRRRATQCGRVRAVGLAAPPDDRRGASGAR